MVVPRPHHMLLLILAFVIFHLPQQTALAAADKTMPAAAAHERVAGLSDEEARKLLISELTEQTVIEPATTDGIAGPGHALGLLLQSLDQQSLDSQTQLRSLVVGIPQYLADFHKTFSSLCPYGTSLGAMHNALWVLLFIGIGLVAEYIVQRFIRHKFSQSQAMPALVCLSGEPSLAGKMTAGLVALLPAVFGLFVFFAAAYVSYFAFIPLDWPFVKLLFLALLVVITAIRLVAIVAQLLLAPAQLPFRILPLDCKAAKVGYRLIVWSWGYLIAVLMFAVVVHRLGAQQETIMFIKAFAATLLLVVTAVAVLYYRHRVAAVIIAPRPDETGQPSWGKQSFAAIWHYLALLYIVILWCLMLTSLTSGESNTKWAFIISFFVLPIWMLADRVLLWLVKHTMLSLKLHSEPGPVEAGQPPAEQDGNGLLIRVNRVARFALGVAFVLWVASLWGYSIPFVSDLSGVVFDALLIMTIAILFWQFISSWIERKIRESMPEETIQRDDPEDEWGTAKAQGRAYTLLPIIRSFVGATLVVMVTLTVLSSMGVDIGPLLAGAGVIGLAVGFGAQKIVSDIFSGVFYLLDDAFRVGEYLSAGSITGTVESISLRNVMLRHHRGMLQIVPHSSMGTITNYMRGGIIEKFSLDFAYDADIDKVRKVIKKVGLEMLEDPELGKDFLRPVRSQGVSAITNSVMTIRVKFTAKPGTQFLIRREAYKRITAALKAKGIEYAHKKVIVDLPMPLAGQADPAQLEKITQAAGAAAREIFDEEEKLKQQLAAQQKGGD